MQTIDAARDDEEKTDMRVIIECLDNIYTIGCMTSGSQRKDTAVPYRKITIFDDRDSPPRLLRLTEISLKMK